MSVSRSSSVEDERRRYHFLFLQPISPRHPVKASLRLASLGLDGTRGRCRALLLDKGMAGSGRQGCGEPMIDFTATATETARGRTERTTLRFFVRYGACNQRASSVRGSSRRITIMRFRPADIRVINRRICLSSVSNAVALRRSRFLHHPASRKA